MSDVEHKVAIALARARGLEPFRRVVEVTDGQIIPVGFVWEHYLEEARQALEGDGT